MARRIYQKVIAPKELSLEMPAVDSQAKRDFQRTHQEWKTIEEQAAQSTIFHKNWYVPELREKYAFHDRMKRIDKVFPYAKLEGQTESRTLLVDICLNELEVEVCAQKAKELKKLGYLYCYREKDSTLTHLLEQIGVI